MAQRILSADERWRAHVRKVRQIDREAPNEGLTDQQVAVLMDSADSEYQVVTQLPSGKWAYNAQATDDLKTAQSLQGLGLIEIMPTLEGETGTLFAWTPVGVALVQELMKRRSQ